jgi:acyl-CoA synthetase (NDP forming)
LYDDGLAMISQSGLVGSAAFIASQLLRPAIGKVIATGNATDLSPADVVRAVASDPTVQVILIHLEGLSDSERFLEALQDARRNQKPVVVLKGGMTEIGAAAAASHTAALAGKGAVFDGVLAEHGVRRTTSLTHMLQVARILRAYPRFASRRAIVLSGSGGLSIVLTDLLHAHGFELATWAPHEEEALREAFSGHTTIANPLDGSGDFAWARSGFFEAIRCADANEDSGGMLDTEAPMTATLLEMKASGAVSKPIVVVWVGGTGQALRDLNAAGMPCFSDLDELARAMATAVDVADEESPTAMASGRPSAALELLADEVRRARNRGDRALDEATSKSVLGAAGIDVTGDVAVSDGSAVVAAAESIGYPVVLKLRAQGLMHKSELGAVVTDVRSARTVEAETARLLAIAEAEGLAGADVLVHRHVPEGVELLLGMHRDPVFGPAVTFGLGGVLAEALDDVQTVTPGVTYSGFLRAFRALKHQPLLAGYRHLPAVDPDVLWPTVEAFCRLVGGLPADVLEIDINPLIVGSDGIVAVDALIVLRPE